MTTQKNMGSRNSSRSRSGSREKSRRKAGSRDRRASSTERERSRSVSRSRSRSPAERRRRSVDREGGRIRRRSRSRSSSPSRRERESRSVSPSCCENEAVRQSWRELKRDYDNFDLWMNVMNLLDQFNDPSIVRVIFDRFLEKYPYCYGFWKKYGEHERRNKFYTEALKVYERGIAAIPYSVDLWQGFLAFMRELAPLTDRGMDKLKDQYDRALSIAGQDFNSDRLWNESIAWEESRGDWKRVSSIYDRLLQTPTAMYRSHYERYESIINMYEPDILLGEEEYEEIFGLVKKHLNMGIDQIVTEETVVEDGPADTIGENGEVKPTITKRKKHHPEALAFYRAEMLARRKRWHEKTTAMVAVRLPFEEQIKRPYFHVKPLEQSQLKNWSQYLNFEMEEGHIKRIRVLFERCLIACALYEQYWLKYARWVYKHEGKAAARDVFARASIHCPKSVNVSLASSAFEESQGDYKEALDILNAFDRRFPDFAAIQMRKIGLLRRKAEGESEPDYTEVVSKWEQLIHSGDTTRHLSSYYSIKLARFHLKSRNDRRLAEKVLRRALERDRDNLQLHLQLIDLAYNDPDFSQTRVLEAFSEALRSNLPDEQRIRISQRKLDFLEDLSYDIDILQEHHELHHVMLQEMESPQLTTRKRKYERGEERGDRRDREDSSRRSRGSHYPSSSDGRGGRGGGDYGGTGGGYGNGGGFYQGMSTGGGNAYVDAYSQPTVNIGYGFYQ